MSENAGIVRRIYDGFSSADYQAALAMLDPAIEWRAIEDTETRHGVEGAAASVLGWLEMWDGHRVEPEEFIEAGDRVLVTVLLSGRGKQSGVQIEDRYFAVWTIRDGRAIAYNEYPTKQEALDAVGLSG
jgi:ketosteroid isomerase-like protein